MEGNLTTLPPFFNWAISSMGNGNITLKKIRSCWLIKMVFVSLLSCEGGIQAIKNETQQTQDLDAFAINKTQQTQEIIAFANVTV